MGGWVGGRVIGVADIVEGRGEQVCHLHNVKPE